MPQEDYGTSQLHHPEEIVWVVFPANDDTSKKTMAVADRHDFAAFAAASRADSRAPFFAELKLASMNDSLKSSFPRSRKSSASFCSKCVSSPERCHCWKRR